MKALQTAFPIICSTLLSCATVVALCFSSSAANLPWILLAILAALTYQFIQVRSWIGSKEADENFARELLQRTGANSVITQLDENSRMSSLLSGIEKAIQAALSKERALAENAADVICVIDTHGKILSINGAAQSAWGYSQSELIGRSISELVVAGSPEETLKPFLGADMSIERVTIENCLKKKNGDKIDLLWSAHWSASDGGLYCIAHDITDRKRSERLLSESEKRVRLILESMPAGIAIINKVGYVEFMNKTSFDLTEYDGESIKGLTAANLFSFAKDPFVSAKFIEAATDETQVIAKSGERIICNLSVKELYWNDSPALLVIFMDLRDKYAVEQAKREFLAMVSHDLRGPLTSINSVLGLLNEGHLGDLDESGKRLTGKTLKESLRLVQMINDLLDMEKMRSGRFVFHLAEVSVISLAKDAVEVVERSAASQGIKILIEGNDCLCVCDAARIIQVFVNLLDNALKFTESGSEIKIDISTEEESGCVVSVCNYGRVISPEKLKLIFEKFEQASPGSAPERKGTGLGLAICKSIVEQHGERIWVESSIADGTRFKFTLGRMWPQASLADENRHELLPKS